MTFIAILGLCITIASFLFGDGLLDKYLKKIRHSYSNAQRKTSNREMSGRGMVKTRIYNSTTTAVSVNFENISFNDLKISGRGASLHPGQSIVLDLDSGNHIWKAKKFIDVTKNAETEDLIYKEGLIRFNNSGEESFLVI